MTVFDRSYYDGIWGSVHRHDYAVSTARQLIAEYGYSRILDVGCGCGALVAALRDEGAEAFGIDLSDYAISNKCSPYVYRGDVRELPFPSQSFDVCFSQGLFDYIEEGDLPTALAELKRIGLRQRHRIDTKGDPNERGFAISQTAEWWKHQFADAGILNDEWHSSAVLIASPIFDGKAYSIQRWIDAAHKLKAPNKELLLVDNSDDESFYNAWHTIVPMIHLDLCHESPNRRIALSMEYIRQRFLAGSFEWWLNIEADIIVPDDAFLTMKRGHEDCDWISHYYPARGGIEPTSGFGCSLFRKRIMKSNDFIDAPADTTTDGWWWHSKIKGTPFYIVELYGMLNIEHLDS